MGFFSSGLAKPQKVKKQEISLKFIRERQCKICPLNNVDLECPKMEPTGSEEPIFYVLNSFPNKEDDKDGEQLVGEAGELFLDHVPRKFRKYLRWNNTNRCYPGKGIEKPDSIITQACSPSIERDIAEAKPDIIIGLGQIPLQWIIGFYSPVYLWRGRKIPVEIGGHKCWFVPTFHPQEMIKQRKEKTYIDWRGNIQSRLEKSLDEAAFVRDIKTLFETYRDFSNPNPHKPEDAFKNIQIASGRKKGDFEKVIEFLERAAKSKLSGYDLETKNIRPYHANSTVLTRAISLGPDDTLAYAWNHPQAGWTEDQKLRIGRKHYDYLISKSRKIVHNLAFEHEWIAYEHTPQVLRAGRWEDTTSQASLLDERCTRKASPGPLSLEFLVMQHFGFNLKALAGDKLDKNNLDKEPIDDVLFYNGGDAKYHRELFLVQNDLLSQDEKLQEGYREKLRQVPTCVITQMVGVPVDHKYVNELSDKYENKIKVLEEELFQSDLLKKFEKQVKRPMKLGSNPDTEILLRDIIGTDIGLKDSGKQGADEKVLREVGHPTLLRLIDWRKASKIKSTYNDPYKETYPDGKLHCIFNTVFTETGRLSADSPNMQNQLKRAKEAKEVRRQVKAPKGKIILAVDYGQIEARVLAMASRDKVFVKALWEGYDVHKEWCERIAKHYPAWVREPMHEFKSDKSIFKRYRDKVKNQFVFPLFFGAGLGKISSELGIPAENIKPIKEEFWDMFEGVHAWHEDANKFYEEYGYAETLTGHHRRRYPLTFNELVNEPIQGTTAEIVMGAMCRLSEREDPDYQPFLNVHDDLSFIVDEDRIDEIGESIISEMLDVQFDFVNVPVTVEMSIGKTWDKMEEIGTYDSFSWHQYPERLAA